MTRHLNIETIWVELSSGLRSFILSKVGDHSVADDILQETYVKIHNNIHNLKDKTRIKPWIYQITRNLVTDYFRDVKKRGKDNPGLLKEISDTPSYNDMMDTAVGDMISMMDELSPEYCEALCLTEIGGLSQKEYAEKKGLSYSGAKSRVQRAKAMLKDILMKCCHYQFDKYGIVTDIQPHCCCCNHPV